MIAFHRAERIGLTTHIASSVLYRILYFLLSNGQGSYVYQLNSLDVQSCKQMHGMIQFRYKAIPY